MNKTQLGSTHMVLSGTALRLSTRTNPTYSSVPFGHSLKTVRVQPYQWPLLVIVVRFSATVLLVYVIQVCRNAAEDQDGRYYYYYYYYYLDDLYSAVRTTLIEDKGAFTIS